MRIVGVACLVVMTTSASAIAEEPDSAGKPTITRTTNDPGDKIICKRRDVAETGTRLGGRKKTCMRAAEWKELEELNEEAKRGLMDQPAITASSDMIGDGAGDGAPQ